MSASNKKKLRKEQELEQLTARQRQEQEDAKKLKIQTISFVTAMVLIVCLFGGILLFRAARDGGWVEKSKIAATIGDEKLNTVEFNYYYIDSINKFYSQWNSDDNGDYYLQAIYGLDTKKPLNEQYTDEAKTETWADYFVNEAITQAQHDYAMYKLATAENFTMSDEHKTEYEETLAMLETYAEIYTGGNVDKYLRALYGNGASLKTYKTYFERSLIAVDYYNAKEATFTTTEQERNDYQTGKEAEYNSYSYISCYLTYTDFRGEGTENEDGSVTYTDAQNEEARQKMTEAAKELATATTLEELKEKAKNAPVSEGKSLSVEEKTDVLHSTVTTEALRTWLSSADRKPGDIGEIPNESTVTADDGTESTVINGYYVVIYTGVNTNETAMADVGYIYVPYQGGTENEDGEMIHSQEDKDNTLSTVEGYLKQWEEGEKTLESLEKLANDLIGEGNAEAGGLIENMNPASDFDAQITAWCLDTSRIVGDTTIIEADDGFYILYYSAKSELNYRQYMLDTELRAEKYEKWYQDAIATVTTAKGDVSKLDLSIVMSYDA